jgi:hypothetical protein
MAETDANRSVAEASAPSRRMHPHDPRYPTRRSRPRASRRASCPRSTGWRRAIDVADAFRDLPGLALLESARPGRGRPLVVPRRRSGRRARGSAPGPDPFAVARRSSGASIGLSRGRAARRSREGSWGFLGYDLGPRLERLPSIGRSTTRAFPPCGSPSTPGPSPGTARRGPGSAGRAVDGDAGALAATPRPSGRARTPAVLVPLRGEPAFPRLLVSLRSGSTEWVRGRCRGGPRHDRRGRDLPGEPDAAPRRAVRRRAVAALPAAPRPASRRCSRRSSTWGGPRVPPLSATGPRRAPLRLARAVPRGRRQRRRPDRSDQGDPARAAAPGRTTPSPRSCSRARRTAPRTS